MAIPAASSLEELIRLPVDSRSMATDNGRSFACKDALAIKALIFVLMTGIWFDGRIGQFVQLASNKSAIANLINPVLVYVECKKYGKDTHVGLLFR
jgi:hypothetical protein